MIKKPLTSTQNPHNMAEEHNVEASLNSETSNTQTPLTGPAKLRRLLAEPDKIVVCPGVYDGFTARLALRAGFECLYMVGSSHNLLEYIQSLRAL